MKEQCKKINEYVKRGKSLGNAHWITNIQNCDGKRLYGIKVIYKEGEDNFNSLHEDKKPLHHGGIR